ncbi:hypothetical protein D3C72_2120070 [compost metagenome]
MHMLEQVQRGLAAPVEVVHVAGLGFQRIECSQVLAHCLQLIHAISRQGLLGLQRVDQLRHHAAQLRIGVAQQVAQSAQGQAHGGRVLLEHGDSFLCAIRPWP